MDILAEVLDGVRLSSTIHCPLAFSAPWGLRVDGRPEACFLVIVDGGCLLEVDGLDGVTALRAGDFVVMPPGSGYVVRDALGSSVVPLGTFLDRCPAGPDGVRRLGGGGAQTTAIGGKFLLDGDGLSPLLRALPPLILIRREQRAAVDWLEQTLEAIACEARSARPGAGAVITRLSDILFIQAVRACVADLPDCGPSWLRALADAQLGPALGEVHRRPEHDWTVARLAAEAAMSRSAFAARFQQVVGEPPLHYVTRWRMHKAGTLLRRTGDSLDAVAAQVGYESEAAFSKAFKRWAGLSPGAYRRAREPA